jgi:lipopolysaccharide transport system permease protein
MHPEREVEPVPATDIFRTAYQGLNQSATADIVGAIRDSRLAWLLGWQDIVQRYRRSVLGPFWLTLSRGILIGAIGLIFGPVFGRPQTEFLPFLASGLIVWSFIVTCLGDGCNAFVSSEALIKQLPLPFFTHILRVWIRNSVILGHDLLIIPIVFAWFGVRPSWTMLLAVPGFLLLSLVLLSAALVLAIMCSRYRDTPQIVQSLLRVSFYLTPIMWMPELLGTGRRAYVLQFNPFVHLVEVVRSPLLNTLPTTGNWIVATGLAIAGSGMALLLFHKKRKRIVFWL